MRPGDPGWINKIPPPEEQIVDERGPGLPPIVHGSGKITQPTVEVPKKRVAIYYGPREGVLAVAVESAPEWDTGFTFLRDYDFVLELLPILDDLGIKVKKVVELPHERHMETGNGREASGASGYVQRPGWINAARAEEDIPPRRGEAVSAPRRGGNRRKRSAAGGSASGTADGDEGRVEEGAEEEGWPSLTT